MAERPLRARRLRRPCRLCQWRFFSGREGGGAGAIGGRGNESTAWVVSAVSERAEPTGVEGGCVCWSAVLQLMVSKVKVKVEVLVRL